ncbi:hypothetical protein A2627_05550 [Candidatus Woesebacteria bacterium RIFCSPHIGHO2_01_FULL_39_28]|uniref:Cytidyltransferase-like domain-containing protein n=1 Tax=Candidatus Woesebacteria bacterium RIFCSPHIGHO2_01_FULL_39_28 TaxID=1802496 RepID=A0A1F7YHM1_9BACT|nr:MAG: hypothetical protein A2627_05550 [Candidatus Woesebacteria bacterium RIFCSPHIGHO2_01_FULL_39_28]OGM56644.1 MAG: hypothetical protein A3A50_04745 [Candidatus Woesebacteria bacterium RIFCSPLOWO2_01_FULL_38_20]
MVLKIRFWIIVGLSRKLESVERELKVILAQGVFDIVHVGHLEYLRKAKLAGDLLFVGIENDFCVRSNKGQGRPFNSLENRLEFLSQLQFVDFTFGFEDAPLYFDPEGVEMYIRRYKELRPNVVAITIGDPNTDLKLYQAEQAGVGFIKIGNLKKDSTTRLLQAIGYE